MKSTSNPFYCWSFIGKNIFSPSRDTTSIVTAHKTALGSSLIEPQKGAHLYQEHQNEPPAFKETHIKKNNFAGKNPFSLHPAELVLPPSEMKNPPRKRLKNEPFGSKSILSRPTPPEFFDIQNEDPFLYVEEEKVLDPIAAPQIRADSISLTSPERSKSIPYAQRRQRNNKGNDLNESMVNPLVNIDILCINCQEMIPYK